MSRQFSKKVKHKKYKISLNATTLCLLVCLALCDRFTTAVLLDTGIDEGSPLFKSGTSFLDSSNNLNLNLEKSIASVFAKVAYGSTTTTKRSIPDVYVPSLTTVPTPLLTTFR
jgi:hypothetical protein